MFVEVWGVVFEFENLSEGLLTALYDEFSGAVKLTEATHAVHKISFEDSLSNIFKKEVERHKGGSSGKKYFTNGNIFESTIQKRFALYHRAME